MNEEVRAPVLASALLGAQIFTSELDFAKVGLTSEGGVDLARWALLAPLWFLPLFVLLCRSGSLSHLAWARPQRYMTLWLLWSLASVLWSVDSRQTLLQGTALAALWITAMWFTHQWGFAALARIFVAATSLLLLSGLVRDLLTNGLGPGSGRAEGLTFNPTNLARVAVLAVLVAGWLLLRTPDRRGWAWVALPTGLVVLAVSESRVAVLSLLVAVLYVIFRRFGGRIALGVGAGIAVLALIAIAWVGSPIEAVGREANPTDLGSLNGRTTIWAVGTELAEARPLIGYGTASGEALWFEAARDGDISWLAVNAHNLALEILLALGIVGLALFGAGLFSYVRRGFGVDVGLDALLLAILLIGATEALVNRPSSTVMLLGALFAIASAHAVATAPPARVVAVAR